MQVFRYDKSFEGLLTAVFDAYFRRIFPDALIGISEPEPMFATGLHCVVTDRAKSDRVWVALQRKLSGDVRRMLMHVWLSEEPGSDELLLRYIKKVFDSPRSVVTDFADDDMLLARKIALRVSKERSYVVQFLRFQQAADGTFFASISPLCNALPLAVGHFRERFADQKWLIYDVKRKYGYYYDLEKVVEITLDDDAELVTGKLADRMTTEDEKLFRRLWKGYFDALAIKERINPKLQRQHMPRRFWKYLTEKQ